MSSFDFAAPSTRGGILLVRGGQPLRGEVAPSGAKNGALPLLLAAALGEAPTLLRNVPLELNDVRLMVSSIWSMGAEVEQLDEHTLRIARGDFGAGSLSAEIAGRMRPAVIFLGVGAALGVDLTVPMPGGCSIGDRKIDLHLMALRALGADLEELEAGIRLRAGPLQGTTIEFDLPTTGGTQNAMIAAALAPGETVLLNANTRVENRELGRLLNAMGADVQISKRVVRIRGQERLRGGAEMTIMPGWDEAVTFMAAAAITGGEVRIKGVPIDSVWWDTVYLRLAGVKIFEWAEDLFVARSGALAPFDLLTGPPPCLNSDMQPIFAALAAFCEGESTLTDNRFKQRFQYTDALQAFGVPIQVFGNTALVRGGGGVRPAQVRASDLRGGAAMVLAALGAEGTSRITNGYQIFRGYPRFDEKLRALGADVTLLPDEPDPTGR